MVVNKAKRQVSENYAVAITFCYVFLFCYYKPKAIQKLHLQKLYETLNLLFQKNGCKSRNDLES